MRSRGGGAIQNGGLSGGSSQSGMAGVFGGVATAKRFNLTLTASFRNALNNVNPATPIGNLSSPFLREIGDVEYLRTTSRRRAKRGRRQPAHRIATETYFLTLFRPFQQF